MKVLAVEPFYGGSHRQFLDGWIDHSRHEWTVLALTANHWKWRMRHAALTLAADVSRRGSERWDVLVCTDMLNLAEFRGLAPRAVSHLPTVAYFHENQLTYPERFPQERDHHFAFTNLVTAACADQVWFNSEFHRREFLAAMRAFLARMPDHRPLASVDQIEQRSQVQSPGVERMPERRARRPGPMRILWAARWEHDKNPELFFEALEQLDARDVPFRFSVVGQSFGTVPEVFAIAKLRWQDRIDHWGFQTSRAAYTSVLQDADLFVSTAIHEFFGIAAVEAMSAGVYPLMPQRLAYPELLALADNSAAAAFYYDGTVAQLSDRLSQLAERIARADCLAELSLVRDSVARFTWTQRAASLDEALELCCESKRTRRA